MLRWLTAGPVAVGGGSATPQQPASGLYQQTFFIFHAYCLAAFMQYHSAKKLLLPTPLPSSCASALCAASDRLDCVLFM